jgi:HEPN superfamily RES-like protein
MGYLKDRMIQEQEQGWSFRDGEDVCFRCLSDRYLRNYVKAEASGFECSFCGRASRKAPSTIPFNSLMEVIGGAIEQYFDQAVNCMGWDGQEGGYQGITYDPYDLVRDEIPTPSENENLLQAIIDSLDDGPWCDRNPYSLSDVERYNSSWDAFCETVKHQVRYFFDSEEDEQDDFSDTIPVPKMLDALRDVYRSSGTEPRASRWYADLPDTATHDGRTLYRLALSRPTSTRGVCQQSHERCRYRRILRRIGHGNG